jgi:hypothetical protein
VLQKLQRPDVPNLIAALNADFKAEPSIGFGDLPIHRQLLLPQLDELKAEHGRSTGFIYTYLRKLAPSADVNLEYDEAEREAWLDRVWAFAEGVTSHKTLKARILYLRLDHDRKKGLYDDERFLSYLKLPRRLPYINEEFLRTYNSDWCDLDADLSDPLISSPPVHNDEELVRDYFLHLFAKAAKADSNPRDLLAPWIEHVSDTWLKPILAEALITNGIGNPERWATLITPTEFQALKDRVDIEFPATNAPQFLPGDSTRSISSRPSSANSTPTSTSTASSPTASKRTPSTAAHLASRGKNSPSRTSKANAGPGSSSSSAAAAAAAPSSAPASGTFCSKPALRAI